MQKFDLTQETLEYNTAEDSTNTDRRFLVAGSQNCLIDQQRKLKIRPGYSRLGAANSALTPVRTGFTWNTSKGSDLPIRYYDDEMEVYLGTVDTTTISAWTRVTSSLSTTATPRAAAWFDATEGIDLLIFTQSDANLYEWNGAVAVVGSIPDGTHITKAGTTTWAQNRFYTTRNKSLTCVRTGTTYTYSAGESSTNLTVTDSTGLVAGDILVQTIVTASNKPAANHTNDLIYCFENQIVVGSNSDELVYISQNDDYDDFSYSSPRVAGEGSLLTLTDPMVGVGTAGSSLVIFCGRSTAFKAEYESITVGSSLTETLKLKKLDLGVDQGPVNQEVIVSINNGLIYLSNEPAVRFIQDPTTLTGINPQTYSNPIKPDLDAETWTGACATWWKNAYYLSSRVNSKLYILNFVQDADGKVRRFWQPPQILPVGSFAIISDWLYGHSNVVPETYKLFDSTNLADVNSDDEKLPINAIAKFAYNNGKDRADLKAFDEYLIEGEITPSTTDLLLDIAYEFGGATQTIEKTIDGSDEDILLGNVGQNSLGQQALGQSPLGGLLTPPSDARKFRVIFEIAKEDYHEIQAQFSTNDIDRYWTILAHGPNATLSPRRATNIYQ